LSILRKALITGVNGFIGKHLTNAFLRKNWHVTGIGGSHSQKLKHNQFIYLDGGIENLSEQNMKNIDYIFHLGFATNIPNSIEHPVETTKDNIGNMIHLLDLSRKAEVKKFVFVSTGSLYGNNTTPWNEEMSPDPIEPYSWQKLSCEYACLMWMKLYGLPTVILRLFQVFGENQRWDTVIALFWQMKKEGKALTLTNAGSELSPKSLERDFVYVGEVADAFVKAAESKKTGRGEVINIASGKATAIEDIAMIIGDEISWIPKRDYEVVKHQADIIKAKQLLGWVPTIDVLQWLENNV